MERKQRRCLWGCFLGCTLLLWNLFAISPGECAYFNNNPDFLAMRARGDHKCDPPADAAIAQFFREKNPALSQKTSLSYARMVVNAAREFGVDPFLVGGIIVKESTVRPQAYSRGCYGLMQIKWSVHSTSIPKAFPSIRSAKALKNPENNIRVGTYMLANFLRKYKGNVDRSLDAYKGSASSRYKSTILKYYKRIMHLYRKKISK